ncbi:MAG: sulfotransferase [Pirellulales bacterium]
MDAPTSHSTPYAQLTYVVGHSRGGTTWLGELIACHRDLRYIFEPFASQAHPYTGVDTQTLFNGGRFIRRQKRGAAHADLPVPQFFREPQTEQDPFAELTQMHLARLANYYFPDERDYQLVVKQPRLENLGWAVHTLRPHRIIILDRHPLGVVNSLSRWNVLHWNDIEWRLFTQDASLTPQQRRLAAAAETIEERILVLSYLRSQYAREFCRTRRDARWFEYESLCVAPRETVLQIWDFLALDNDDASRQRLDATLAAREPEADNSMHDTHQDPLRRSAAWRAELPADVRERLLRFIEREALDIPLPGAGLPPLTRSEQLASERHALRQLWRRCRQWLSIRAA